ncbi:hypothetical protein T07_1714, partial [Trichinella nelsoni]
GVPFRSESDEVDPEKRFREGLSYDGTRYSDVHSSILHSYLVNGWAEEITSEGPKGRTWYLPHHVVGQQGPEAIMHCIVFDGTLRSRSISSDSS